MTVTLQDLIDKQVRWQVTMPNATVGEMIELNEIIERKFNQLQKEVHFGAIPQEIVYFQ